MTCTDTNKLLDQSVRDVPSSSLTWSDNLNNLKNTKDKIIKWQN